MWALVLLLIFLGCNLVQWFFFAGVAGRVAFFKARTKQSPQQAPANAQVALPPLSVVIAARNEVSNLQTFLPQILAQDYPEFQVVVVDDRSGDATYDYLIEMRIQHPNLHIVRIDEAPDHLNSKKYALTLGIKGAKHETLVLTDADCWPASPHWLRAVASRYAPNTQIVLGFSQYRQQKGFLNHFIRFETLYTALSYLGLALAGVPYMGVGRNLSYTKTLFWAGKGFLKHKHYTGGDDDLFVNEHANKRNTRALVHKEGIVWSVPKSTWSSFFKQKKRHLRVGKLYKARHKWLLGLLHGSHLLYWLLGLVLAATGVEPYILGGSLLLRWLCLYGLFIRGARQLGDDSGHPLLALLDFVYVFYYILTGIVALFSKTIQWK